MIMAGVWQGGVAFDSVDANGQASLNARNLVHALQWWVFAALESGSGSASFAINATPNLPSSLRQRVLRRSRLTTSVERQQRVSPRRPMSSRSTTPPRLAARGLGQQFNGASGSQESNSDADAGVEGNRS